MGLLRRRAPGPEVPAWASVFTREQYGVFMALVDAVLDARGVQRTSGDGFVQLSDAQDRRVLGLTNLAQLCLATDRHAWPEAVEGHFAALLDAPAQPPRPEAAEALPALRVKIWARADVPVEEPIISQAVADDLLAVLTLALPGCIANVRPPDAEGWGQPESALWERALANTSAAVILEPSPLALPGGIEVVFGFSDDMFTASVALWPEALAGPLGPAGALVAVPNRHTVAVHAVRHMGVLEGMRHLVPLIARQYGDGPGSISDQLYWAKDGELTRISTTVDGDWVSVTPPMDFVAAVNALPAPETS